MERAPTDVSRLVELIVVSLASLIGVAMIFIQMLT